MGGMNGWIRARRPGLVRGATGRNVKTPGPRTGHGEGHFSQRALKLEGSESSGWRSMDRGGGAEAAVGPNGREILCLPTAKFPRSLQRHKLFRQSQEPCLSPYTARTTAREWIKTG